MGHLLKKTSAVSSFIRWIGLVSFSSGCYFFSVCTDALSYFYTFEKILSKPMQFWKNEKSGWVQFFLELIIYSRMADGFPN